MRHAEDVIIKPIMTEKSYSEIANGKYTFEVALNSSKVKLKMQLKNFLVLRF